MITEVLCTDREQLVSRIADRCEEKLNHILENNSEAGLIVPGGTTPAPAFELLSRKNIDWQNIFVTPSDERWIETTDENSNQYLINNSLLINNASSAHLIPLKNSHLNVKDGQAETENALSQLPLPNAVTMLGMGPDGHFASLFPNTPQINEALDLSSAVKSIPIDASGCPVAGEYTERLSLTLTALLNSQLVMLFITGQDKLNIIRKAIEIKPSVELPVSILLSQTNTDVEIYWAE